MSSIRDCIHYQKEIGTNNPGSYPAYVLHIGDDEYLKLCEQCVASIVSSYTEHLFFTAGRGIASARSFNK